MAKVLLIAYACDADDVSETWCSWQWTRRLAARHDATVLVYNRRDRAGVATASLPGARVLEWSELSLFERVPSLTHTLKPGYLHFHRRARSALRDLVARERFDLVHQYEPFAPRYPSPAVGLGIPFVLGPVGGGVETPPAFGRELAGEMPWFTRLRALDRWRFRHDPWLRRTYEGADVVLGIAPYVRELLEPVVLRRFELFHETGVDHVPAPRPPRRREPGEARLLYVGRVVRSKGVRDAVRAMAFLSDLERVTLDVVGDGGDRAACEREAAALGVAGRVRFHGWRDAATVQEFYRDADVFVFPSLREASGQVVIEAMSHGLALVVAAGGGPGFTVQGDCGVAVEPTTPEDYPRALAQELRALVESPARMASLGRNARDKVAAEFLWDRKVERMSKLYDEVIAASRRGGWTSGNAADGLAGAEAAR